MAEAESQSIGCGASSLPATWLRGLICKMGVMTDLPRGVVKIGAVPSTCKHSRNGSCVVSYMHSFRTSQQTKSVPYEEHIPNPVGARHGFGGWFKVLGLNQ